MTRRRELKHRSRGQRSLGYTLGRFTKEICYMEDDNELYSDMEYSYFESGPIRGGLF